MKHKRDEARITIIVPKEFKAQVKVAADGELLPLSLWCRQALAKAIKEVLPSGPKPLTPKQQEMAERRAAQAEKERIAKEAEEYQRALRDKTDKELKAKKEAETAAAKATWFSKAKDDTDVPF